MFSLVFYSHNGPNNSNAAVINPKNDKVGSAGIGDEEGEEHPNQCQAKTLSQD